MDAFDIPLQDCQDISRHPCLVLFPEEGEVSKMYFDTEEKILYYWDNEYYPVNATLIANTIIEGGGV